ncbi:hypothetical protein [Leucobacter iarius]|uniref:Phage gp6-like head-tail connector protein n=1 Tax=Leucobacter iarius TaxID=333963 RepID=A0ABN2LK49_9MICO
MATSSTTPPPATDLAWYVDAIDDDAPYAERSKHEAETLVHGFIGGENNPFGVPVAAVERAVLEVGADLYYRRLARNGITSFEGDMAPQPMRLNRDPMTAAYPFLRPFLVSGL